MSPAELVSSVQRLLGSYEVGAKVTVFDNFSSGRMEYLSGLNVQVIRGNISDEKSVDAALKNQEIVFHLAALPFIPDCYLRPWISLR